MLKKTVSVILTLVFILGLVCNGCDPKTTTPPETAATPRGNTGVIETGKTVTSASETVPPSGGTVTVRQTDSPLDGLELEIPAGAYACPVDLTVSYAPITDQSFGEGCNPVTPMITVTGAHELSGEVMTVTVPVTVPQGHFAMGFIYDADTNKLTGMNTVAQDAASITIATRHFSSFFISSIDEKQLRYDLDTGFRPGIDDWQFDNWGSYIAPGGHCAGQSVTALWYYVTQPDGKDLALYGRYDNNGEDPETPDFQYDDSLGYRFASAVHHDIDWASWENKFWYEFGTYNDATTFMLFAYAMMITGEPQEVGIYSKAGGGHDMICYRIHNGELYIADPNYHGNTERRIAYDSGNGTFSPYNSGANAEEIANGKGRNYETIQYCAKSMTIDWDTITARWQEMKNGTIGDNLFPGYNIVYQNSQGNYEVLPGGHVAAAPKIEIGVQRANANDSVSFVLFRDGAVVKPDANRQIELLPGNNKIGVYVVSPIVKKDDKGRNYTVYKYVDFKYVNIIYNALAIDPEEMVAETGEYVTFKASGGSPPSGAVYRWMVDDEIVQEDTDNYVTLAFNEEGVYLVILFVLDGSGNIAGSAMATAFITQGAAPLPTATAAGTSFNKLYVAFGGHGLYYSETSWGTSGEYEDSISLRADFSSISWSGGTFSGNNGDYSITGTVNGDNTITFVMTYHRYENGELVLYVNNLPLSGDRLWRAEGPDVQYYVALTDYNDDGSSYLELLELTWDYDPDAGIQKYYVVSATGTD